MRQADLAGSRILILEDDFYLASDAQTWLENAGAEVLGPTGSLAKALDLVRNERIDGALVDINLGTGPSFEVSRALEERGVPFAFVTGYDDDVIPADLNSAPRLQKPVKEQSLVAAVGSLLKA
jgi:DNA-binding response OmpR family regulator